MGKIVVDASAMIAVILGEPERASMVRLTRGAHLIAPPSLKWEVGNAFSAMFRRKRLSLNDALLAIEIFDSIPIDHVTMDLMPALEIAHEKGLYAYDAYMLACAIHHKASLLTLDKALMKMAADMKINVLEV
jgi:predicted nucleic acid-binding protein